MRDGRAEGLPAIRNGGHAAISFMPDTEEGMFASLKVHNLKVYVYSDSKTHWLNHLKEANRLLCEPF